MTLTAASTYLNVKGNNRASESKYFIPYVYENLQHILDNSYTTILRKTHPASTSTVTLKQDYKPLVENISYDYPVLRAIRDTWHDSVWFMGYLATEYVVNKITGFNYESLINSHDLDTQVEDVLLLNTWRVS